MPDDTYDSSKPIGFLVTYAHVEYELCDTIYNLIVVNTFIVQSTSSLEPVVAPYVLSSYLLGHGREKELGCYDVYGLDAELLEMVPKPVLAVLNIYPLSSQSEHERIQKDAVTKGKSESWSIFRSIIPGCT
ncbi:hypothetical protein AgCh_016691 [Apium graveolens]